MVFGASRVTMPMDSLDGLIVDLAELDVPDKDGVKAAVARHFQTILYRLKQAGLYPPTQVALVAPHSFIEQYDFDWQGHEVNEIEVDDFSDRAYLLVFRAQGFDLIVPPYDLEKRRHLTWHEYFVASAVAHLVGSDTMDHLIIRAPWAQAKIVNIKPEKA